MLGTGTGFAAGAHAHTGLGDFTGLDNLVSNGNDNMMVNHGGHHGHHHGHHLLHHHMPHHSHYSLAALTSPTPTHPHSAVTSSAHPSNQPLPPHRPFTPPGAAGAIGSHLLHSTTANTSLENNNSYSPNSTTTASHLPSSTVKIKSGKMCAQNC